jgi:hypothetical protein
VGEGRDSGTTRTAFVTAWGDEERVAIAYCWLTHLLIDIVPVDVAPARALDLSLQSEPSLHREAPDQR